MRNPLHIRATISTISRMKGNVPVLVARSSRSIMSLRFLSLQCTSLPLQPVLRQWCPFQVCATSILAGSPFCLLAMLTLRRDNTAPSPFRTPAASDWSGLHSSNADQRTIPVQISAHCTPPLCHQLSRQSRAFTYCRIDTPSSSGSSSASSTALHCPIG